MTDAEMRLRQWIKDYGASKHRAFIADLEAVLDEVVKERRAKSDCMMLVEERDQEVTRLRIEILVARSSDDPVSNLSTMAAECNK